MTSVARFAPLGLAVLRIVAGALLLEHGLIKLTGFPPNAPPGQIPFDSVTQLALPAAQLWVGAIIETVTGALLVLGLFTRTAAFFASGLTAVAYWQFHFHFPNWVYPAQQGGGEVPILFSFIFLYIFLAGPGTLSIDSTSKK